MTLKKNQKTKHPVYYIVTLCDSYMLNGVKKKKKDKTKKKIVALPQPRSVSMSIGPVIIKG